MDTRNWFGASAALVLALGFGTMAAPAVHAQNYGQDYEPNYGPEPSAYADAPPPPIPDYDQPPIPAPGYIWTPGYWAWDGQVGDYYWVPGAWVLPPEPGLLWTPAYWGWADGRFGFFPGYWAPQVGFYGGVDYGFGYNGFGYEGGYWRGRDFYYNRAANNLRNMNGRYVYERDFPRREGRRAAYSGGPGGVQARPTPQQLDIARQRHAPPTAEQMQHMTMARRQPDLRAGENQGRPPIAATQRPGEYQGPAVVPATRPGGGWHGPQPGAVPGYQRPAAINQQSAGEVYRGGAPGGQGAPQAQRYRQAEPYVQGGQPGSGGAPPAYRGGQPGGWHGSQAQPAPNGLQAQQRAFQPQPRGQGAAPRPQPQAQAARAVPRPPEKAPPQRPDDRHPPQ